MSPELVIMLARRLYGIEVAVAPPFAESLLRRLGHHYRRETDRHHRRPPIG